MDRQSSVNNGVLVLPPGFRFHPTDEELVLQYLKRKAFAFPLPASVIQEIDAYNSDPWDLPGDLKQERYFFSRHEAKILNGKKRRVSRATPSGYWWASGLEKKVFTSEGNQLVGKKRALVFCRGRSPRGYKTDWIMHEYRLVSPKLAAPRSSSQKKLSQSLVVLPKKNWAVCRIFLKKARGQVPWCRMKAGTETEFSSPTTSSSASSGITEASSISDDDLDQETCSSCRNC